MRSRLCAPPRKSASICDSLKKTKPQITQIYTETWCKILDERRRHYHYLRKVRSWKGKQMQNGFMKLLCFGILLGTCAGSLPSVVLSQELPKDLWTRKRGRDWPSFLGPRRDSKSTERGIRPWPVTGPRIVWTKPLGEGYGIGSVARGRFFQFDHINGQARLLCLNAETGEEIWTFTYQSNYRDMFGYDSGPRCSPVIDGDRVYILGVEGQLHCLNINTGKVRWQHEVAQGVGRDYRSSFATPSPATDGFLSWRRSNRWRSCSRFWAFRGRSTTAWRRFSPSIPAAPRSTPWWRRGRS